MQAIYFDMDGTIANLYDYDNWLELLRSEQVEPYCNCKPINEIEEVRQLLNQLKHYYTIGIISWSSKNGSKDYCKAVRRAKKQWIDKYLPCIISEFHVVKYGTPKHYVCKLKDSILVDDNAEVRKAWRGETIDATKDIILALKELLEILEG